jgi:hypothetical protein
MLLMVMFDLWCLRIRGSWGSVDNYETTARHNHQKIKTIFGGDVL